MNTRSKNVVSIGFVDTFEGGHFTGWTFTNSSVEQKVILKLNGHRIQTVNADGARPDVKAAGIDQLNCGFDFTLRLEDLPKDGCFISLHEPLSGKELTNGTFLYKNGEISPQAKMDFKPDELPISAYISVHDAASANQNTHALLELAMKVLAKHPAATLVAMSYLLILGRIPDPDGFIGSLRNKLTSDAEKREFLLNVINSAEFASRRSIASATSDLKKFAP